MANPPQFLKFHCATTNEDMCTNCPRDFVLMLDSIEGFYKDKNGLCVIGVKSSHSSAHPLCLQRNRYIETSATYDEVVIILNGDMHDFGNIYILDKGEVV